VRKSASRAVVPREGAESRDRMMDVAYFMDPADKPRDDNIKENEQNLIYATTLYTALNQLNLLFK